MRFLLLLFIGPAWAQTDDDRKREQEWRVPEMIAAMNVPPGSRVADLGAGDGFIAARLARAVGPTGVLWAVDIDSKNAIPALRSRVKKEKLRNVRVVARDAADPHLPLGGLDAVLTVVAYHEFEKLEPILRHVREALKPDGRFVVVDLAPCRTRGQSRAVQVKAHVMSPDIAESELRSAGFEIVSRDDHFIDRPDQEWSRWMIVCKVRE